MNQVRTPIGCVLMITAGTGIFMGAHWSPLVPLMLAFYLVTLLAPSAARNSLIWFVMAAAWVAAVMIQPSAMEDHVYLYLAWLVAIAVGLLDRDNFMDEAGRQGRHRLCDGHDLEAHLWFVHQRCRVVDFRAPRRSNGTLAQSGWHLIGVPD